MRVGKLLLMSGTALTLTLAACSSPSTQSSTPTTSAEATQTTSAPPPTQSTGTTGASADLCAAVAKLGKSVNAIKGGSPAESQAKLDEARQDYEAVKRAAGGQYSVRAEPLDQAMENLQNESKTGGTGAASRLAAAYKRFDGAVNCP